MEDSHLEKFVELEGSLHPDAAAAKMGGAQWAIVRDAAGKPVALLAPDDLTRGAEAGATHLLHPEMKLAPTAVVARSTSLDEIADSSVVEVIDRASGLIVVDNDAPSSPVGVLPSRVLAEYLGRGDFRPPSRELMGAERVPGISLLDPLRIACATCGWINAFEFAPLPPMPQCQNLAEPHPFA